MIDSNGYYSMMGPFLWTDNIDSIEIIEDIIDIDEDLLALVFKGTFGN